MDHSPFPELLPSQDKTVQNTQVRLQALSLLGYQQEKLPIEKLLNISVAIDRNRKQSFLHRVLNVRCPTFQYALRISWSKLFSGKIKKKNSGQTRISLSPSIVVWMERQVTWFPHPWGPQDASRRNRMDCFLFPRGNEKLLLIIYFKESNNSTKFCLVCTLASELPTFQISFI